jgi:PKD repeat protein
VTGDTLAGDSHTFLVDVRSIAQNSPVIFSLDFLGNGSGDGNVVISDVGIVVVEAPVAVADRYNSFQGVPLTINPLANDKSSLGTIIDPTTLKITTRPQFGQVIVNNDGTLTYTPNLGFIGVDVLTYTVVDNHGVTSNTGVATLKVARPRVLIQESVVPTSIVAGTVGNFAIEASSQTNTAITYRWDFGDGTKAIGQNINHIFANTGTYNVSLTAIDQQNIRTVENYTVIATNEAPKVLGIDAPAVTVAGQRNVFKSIDQDADVLAYRWSFGDGSQPVYEAAPNHVFDRAGTYNVELQVTDPHGLQTVYKQQLQVELAVTSDRTPPIIIGNWTGTTWNLGSHFSGNLDGTGSKIAVATYQFDGGATKSLYPDAQGNFDVIPDWTGVTASVNMLTVTARDAGGLVTSNCSLDYTTKPL